METTTLWYSKALTRTTKQQEEPQQELKITRARTTTKTEQSNNT
jgi:hypothetical protein